MEQKRKILPPVYLLCALLAMAALDYYFPLWQWARSPFNYAGALPLLLGIIVAGIAARAFVRAGTPVIPFETSTALVTDGLYRFTRNPMYLGMVMVLVGAGILFGSVTALLPVPLFFWIIVRNFIRGEERFLESLFGQHYLDYKARVRRWL